MLCLILSISIHTLQRYSIIDKIRLAIIVLARLSVCYLIKLRRSHFGTLKNDCIFWQKLLNNKIDLQLA